MQMTQVRHAGTTNGLPAECNCDDLLSGKTSRDAFATGAGALHTSKQPCSRSQGSRLAALAQQPGQPWTPAGLQPCPRWKKKVWNHFSIYACHELPVSTLMLGLRPTFEHVGIFLCFIQAAQASCSPHRALQACDRPNQVPETGCCGKQPKELLYIVPAGCRKHR